jgi:hypothetical protein
MAEDARRRTDRVSITLPVSVSGLDATGKAFSEDAFTVTVSQYGAAIALKTALAPNQKILIRRHRTRVPREAECHVIGQIGKQANLQVFSVAFQKPAVGFWDVYFPSLPPDTETTGRTVLQCTICNTRKIVHLDSRELTLYTASRQLPLQCHTCGKTTNWFEAGKEAVKQPELSGANPVKPTTAPSPPVNQRKHRRVAAEIPICIRQAGSADDVATTLDISRGGLCFTSSRQYRSGSYIQVAVPYSPTALNVFVDACVIHCSKVPEQKLYRHGIKYLAENQPPY